jgi:Rha family phage regulatory protein|nr:MAG TPA: regulatory protein [Caudoviricetes sp.]
MNELVFKGQNNKVVTTSLKIAEVFGKEHQHILRDIRELIDGVSKIGDTPMFEETTYIHPQNKQQYPMFLMNRDGFTLLAMGFTGDKALRFKMAYINASNEMEKALKAMQPKLPQTYKEALKELLIQVEENERLQIENKDMKPKAEYFDEIVDRGGLTNFRDTAKLLGVSEKAFIFFLIDKKYIYRDQKGTLKPVAKYVGTYFELKEWVRGEKTGTQTLITAKGKEQFLELINSIKL